MYGKQAMVPTFPRFAETVSREFGVMLHFQSCPKISNFNCQTAGLAADRLIPHSCQGQPCRLSAADVDEDGEEHNAAYSLPTYSQHSTRSH